MREFFWRRRNARLLTRLNSVVETSERVRKSYRPKAPRVVIDTSYVEQARGGNSPLASAGHSAQTAVEDDLYGEAEADVFCQRRPPYDDNEHSDGDYGEHDGGDLQTSVGGNDLDYGEEAAAEDFDLLKEAVAQLELADRREAELREREAAALDEVRTLRDLVDELNRTLVGEQKARAEARNGLATLHEAYQKLDQADRADKADQRRDDGLQQKLKSQQERVARLEVMLNQEQASRAAAERMAVEARQQAGELQSQIEQLTRAKAKDSESKEREQKAQQEAAELRQKLASLEAASADETTRRRDAEARCKKAEQTSADSERRLADAERRLAVASEAAGQMEDITRREKEARQKLEIALTELAQAVRQADELADGMASLEAKLGEQSGALLASESECQRLEQALSEAGHMAATVAKLTKKVEATERDLVKARRREAELSSRLIEASKRAEAAEAAASEEQAARQEATMRLEQAEMAAADAARELTEVRIAADSRSALKSAGDEKNAGQDGLSQRIAELELELVEARHREGDVVRQLGVVKKRGAQFEEAVSAEQAARHAAEERMELAERAAEEAADALSSFKVEAARREAELLARIELGRMADAAATTGGTETTPAKTSAASYEPPSKVPSVMRGAFGTAQQPAPAPAQATAETAGSDEFLPPAKLGQTAKGKQARRDQRFASRMPVTLWRQGMSQAVNCTLLDKSASGARVELPQTKFGESMSAVGIGDKLTLTFTTAQERSSVSCQIMWMDGRQCGLKYCGPFHTEVIKSRKPTARGKSILAR